MEIFNRYILKPDLTIYDKAKDKEVLPDKNGRVKLFDQKGKEIKRVVGSLFFEFCPEYLIPKGVRYKRIPNFPDYLVLSCGEIMNSKGRLLVGGINSAGYRRVILVNSKERKRVFVHRLVAEAFLGPFKRGEEVNHIDGNKRNNNVNNLEWISKSDNIKHAWKTGLIHMSQSNVIHKNRKIDERFVPIMAVLKEAGILNVKKWAERYNCKISAIYNAIKRHKNKIKEQ